MPSPSCPIPEEEPLVDAVDLGVVMDAVLDVLDLLERIADRLGCLDAASST